MIGMCAPVVGLDTNVLARYVLHDDEEQLALAGAVIDGLTRDRPGFVTDVTLVELDWVMRRGYAMSRDSRLAVIRALVESDSVEFEDGEGVVRALTLAEEGADFADALISSSMELFGVDDVVTFDQAAAQRLGWRLLV